MAANNFAACLAVVLKEEGGYSNRPDDRGGPTSLGVTQATWQHWLGANRIATAADIKALTVSDVTPLYAQGFWKPIQGELLPAGVDMVTFDFGINSGPGRAIRELQAVLGIPTDGLVGPMTLTAALDGDHNTVIAALSAARIAFMKSLSDFAANPGWVPRVERVEAAAKAMLPA